MIEYRPTAPDLTHDHAGGTALPAVAMDLAPTGRVRYTTRLPAPDPNAVCYPEIDPDEEPYGDTAAWMPEARREAVAGTRIVAAITILCGIGGVLVMAWFATMLIRVFWPHS